MTRVRVFTVLYTSSEARLGSQRDRHGLSPMHPRFADRNDGLARQDGSHKAYLHATGMYMSAEES
jgi:hypothetical protein